MRSFHRLVAILAFSATVTASQAQDPVARLEIASYQQLSADVASLGLHIQNPMLNMGLMALGNALGAPGLLGLDQERPIRLAIFADGGDLEKAQRVLVLPVLDDGGKYLEALKVNYTSVEDDGNVRRFRANRNVQSFREMSVVMVDGYAVVSPSKPLVDRVAGWLKEAPDRLAVGGIAGSVLASFDATAVLPALRRRLDEQARAAEAQVAEGPAAAIADMTRVYAEAAIGILEQTVSLKLSLQCNAQGLTVYGRLDAAPDSTLAKLFAESQPPSAALRRLLPADATMVYASGALGAFMRHGMEPYMAFARKLMEMQKRMMAQIGGDAFPAGFNMDKLFEQALLVAGAYGDDFVFSFGPSAPGQPSVLFEAITVKDANKVLAAMDESVATASSAYAEMGIPVRFVKRANRTIDGAEVRVFAAEITKPEPKEKPAKGLEAAAPAENPGVKADVKADAKVADEGAKAEAEDEEGEEPDDDEVRKLMAEAMTEQMQWLTKGVMELTVVDNVLLLTMGSPGALDPFIAKVRKPPEDVWTARSKALFPEMRNHDKAVELWSLRLLELVKGMAPLFDTEGALKEALSQLPDDGQGMGGLTMSSSTATMAAFRISAAQLGAMARSVQTLQQIGQQANRAGRPPEAPMGAPVDVVIPEN